MPVQKAGLKDGPCFEAESECSKEVRIGMCALSGLHEPLAEIPPQGDQIARARPPTSGTLAFKQDDSQDESQLWLPRLYKSTKECRRSSARAQLKAATSSSGNTKILGK